MATTKRESTLGKEKRGTISSNSSIALGQRRPSAGSTAKQAPNYLRPTASSHSDATKNVKKTGTEDTSQQPNPVRRRSFDRPPSAAPVHKALGSPGTQKPTAFRSASSSSKSATTPKATLVRVVKKPNAVKPMTLSSSRSVKKTPTPTTKKVNTSSAPSSHDKIEAQNLESKHEKEEILDHQVEEVVKDDQGEIDDAEMPKAEESEHPDVVDTTEVKNVEGKDTLSDISTISEEHNVPQTEEMEDTFHEEKSDPTQDDEDKNHSKEEVKVGHDQEEKIPHGETKTETEDDRKEVEDRATDEVTAGKEIGDEKHIESRQENGEGSEQGLESSKEEIVEGVVEESESEAANVVVNANANAKSQVQAGHGKKGSSTPYNDVIEETACKLLEERKNKVKALVGAFETVIDKETSSAK